MKQIHIGLLLLKSGVGQGQAPGTCLSMVAPESLCGILRFENYQFKTYFAIHQNHLESLLNRLSGPNPRSSVAAESAFLTYFQVVTAARITCCEPLVQGIHVNTIVRGPVCFGILGVGTVKSHQRGGEFQVGKLNFSIQLARMEFSCVRFFV